MSLLEKVKNLISQVENEAEKTDKRKLIDEVAGMMKSAGCDDEVIRTAIGKMEKLSYDESEAGKADNKAKNEEDEVEEFEEEEEIAENKKKAKNEDDKQEDEKEEKEEDKEEEAENKCKNSMDDVKRAILGGSSKVENTGYVSQAKRLEMGNKY